MLVEWSKAIELIERCSWIIGPALLASQLSHDVQIHFVAVVEANARK
jgi:hypothetical protein